MSTYVKQLEDRIEHLEKILESRECYQDDWNRSKEILKELRECFKNTHFVNNEYFFDVIEASIFGIMSPEDARFNHEDRKKVLKELRRRRL